MVTFITALAPLYLPEAGADRRGQSLVEYALIILLIAIAVIVAITALAGQLNTVFNQITASFNTVG